VGFRRRVRLEFAGSVLRFFQDFNLEAGLGELRPAGQPRAAIPTQFQPGWTGYGCPTYVQK